MPTTKTAEKNDDKGERKENEKKRRQQLGRRKNKITKKLGKNSVALGSYRATGVHPHVSPYPPPAVLVVHALPSFFSLLLGFRIVEGFSCDWVLDMEISRYSDYR